MKGQEKGTSVALEGGNTNRGRLISSNTHQVDNIGGSQGPKALLDAVRQAVQCGHLDVLLRLKKDFLSVSDNAVKCIGENGDSIVHLALSKSTATLQFVIDELQGPVNMPNFQGRTPLHEAVTRNYVECCEMLLSYGADGSVQSATLSTPFHTAAACGSVECMEVLLKHSADPVSKVNELDKTRSSALHKCAFDGDVRVSRWLVEHGAIVDARDNTDTTPLLAAVKMGQRDVTEYLLAQQADCNRSDQQGNRCIHFCAIRCDTVILNMLLKAGAKVQVKNNEFNNPLHLAALHPKPNSKEWEDLIAILLLAGCDPNEENAARKKPADFLGRSLKRLFSLEEVKKRKERESQLQREVEEDLEQAMALRSTWRATVNNSVAEWEKMERAEDERMARETEDRLRADDDARILLEEMLVTRGFLEEEIKRKKVVLEKAKSKAAR